MQLWKGETVRKTDVTWAVIPTRDNSPMSEGGTGNGHSNDVRGLAFNGLGTLCASCGADNKIVVWAAKTASAVISMVGHTNEVNDCAFFPGEDLLISVSNDMTCKVRRCKGCHGCNRCSPTVACYAPVVRCQRHRGWHPVAGHVVPGCGGQDGKGSQQQPPPGGAHSNRQRLTPQPGTELHYFALSTWRALWRRHVVAGVWHRGGLRDRC